MLFIFGRKDRKERSQRWIAPLPKIAIMREIHIGGLENGK